MSKHLFLPVSIISIFGLLIFPSVNLNTIAQNTPQKAFFNITNNSDVDLQYYGCDGANPMYMSDESDGGINAGLNNQQGEYLQTEIVKNKTTILALPQAFDFVTNQNKPLPANITIKVAAALPASEADIFKICSSTNTSYIKSITVPVSTAAAKEITITGSGNTVTPKKGFVNGTSVPPTFDLSQEYNSPLQNTTSSLPKITFASSGPPTAGASVCVDNVVTPVTINSSNRYELSLPAGTSPSLSVIATSSTCSTNPAPLVISNIQSNNEYNTNIAAFTPPNIFAQGSPYTLSSTRYIPFQKGIYVSSAAPTPNSPQSTYTNLAKACVNNVVQNEVAAGSGYVLVGTGPQTILPVTAQNTCDTTARSHTINTPANTSSNLILVNVHDKTQPLNLALTTQAQSAPQQPTIQTPVSTPLPTSGTINSIANTVSTTMLLERDLSGNLSIKESNVGTASQDLLTIQLEFTGTTNLPAGTTVTYTPITNSANLTDGGAGLPQGATQLSTPFEITLSPKPANAINMTVSVNQAALSKQLSQVNSANIKAFASNSPFAQFNTNVSANSISAIVPNGFKQFAIYELGTSNGLIRTGGSSYVYFVTLGIICIIGGTFILRKSIQS
jgi:hypothetical protein